jgi:TfoX/Sxy family transcriptional regulator of competence genes
MDWEKSSAELITLFESIAPQRADVTQKKMFGWPCSFVTGNLFAGLHKQSMLFRLSVGDQKAFLEQEGAAEFEPMPGRKMKDYVILDDPLKRDREQLSRWMDRALQHASALPAKAKKTTRKK